MPRTPGVSLVVPAHNIAPYIGQCLDSLVVQTMESKEIIVVNDGSTDDTGTIASGYAEKYSFIRVLEQKQNGVSAARNAGLRAAAGDYVMFIDGDDFIDKDAVRFLYSVAIDQNVDIVRAGYCFYNNETGETSAPASSYRIPCVNTAISGKEYIVQSIPAQCYDVSVCINLYRRRYLLDNDLFFREGIVIAEDHEHTLRTLAGQDCIVYQSDKTFYYYRQRSGSVTKLPTMDHCSDLLSVVTFMAEVCENGTMDSKTRDACYAAVSTVVCHLGSIYGHALLDPACGGKRIKLSSSLKKLAVKYAPDRYTRLKVLLFAYTPGLLCFGHRLRHYLRRKKR